MKLRIVEKGDRLFEVQIYTDEEKDWIPYMPYALDFCRFKTYDEAVLFIENKKDEQRGIDKSKEIKQIYEEFEI